MSHDPLYDRARWKRLAAHHRRVEPVCRMCRADGITMAVEVIDHVIPHRGNLNLFFDSNNLQALCSHHHSGAKQREEVGSVVIDKTIGADGWPTSPQHYANSGKYTERKKK
jgi:5-methylcytosine-specific restriction protein A